MPAPVYLLYYYKQLDRLFPGIREKYENRYGDKYSCAVPGSNYLEKIFNEHCSKYNIASKITPFKDTSSIEQLRLL
jgi:hypothetical protein